MLEFAILTLDPVLLGVLYFLGSCASGGLVLLGIVCFWGSCASGSPQHLLFLAGLLKAQGLVSSQDISTCAWYSK